MPSLKYVCFSLLIEKNVYIKRVCTHMHTHEHIYTTRTNILSANITGSFECCGYLCLKNHFVLPNGIRDALISLHSMFMENRAKTQQKQAQGVFVLISSVLILPNLFIYFPFFVIKNLKWLTKGKGYH